MRKPMCLSGAMPFPALALCKLQAVLPGGPIYPKIRPLGGSCKRQFVLEKERFFSTYGILFPQWSVTPPKWGDTRV